MGEVGEGGDGGGQRGHVERLTGFKEEWIPASSATRNTQPACMAEPPPRRRDGAEEP